MEIYLVRHTETVCEKGVCYGQSDVDILPDYKKQFESIKDQIPENAVFYSSPLKRCTILADYLSDSCYKTDSRLMEMHFGDWELKAWNDIPREVLDPWMNDFVNVAVPNGESFIDLDQRVWDFLEKKLEKSNEKPLILVTHSGVIRSVLCRINNIPLQEAFATPLDYGVVVKVEYTR